MARHLSRRIARLRDARGANLVEAAIVTPLLLFLTFAIVDFALLFYVYLALENGVSQGSRYGVTGNQVSGLSREASIRQAARQATPTLTLPDDAFAFSHLPPGSTTWLSGTGGPNEIGKVTISYTWKFFTPLVRPFFDKGQIVLKVESAMKNEGRFTE